MRLLILQLSSCVVSKQDVQFKDVPTNTKSVLILTTFKASLIFLFFCIPIQTFSAFEIEGDSISRDDGSVITYCLDASLPKQENVLLVILHGSDCNSVTKVASIENELRKSWPGSDLLTIEKYGLGSGLPYSSDGERPDCPKEYLLNDTPEQRANDVVSVLGHLKQHHKYKHIVVLGGSEGGLISNLVASRVNYLSASISFNGGGRWFLNDVIHSIRSQTKSPVNADEEVQGFKQFAKQILSGKPFDLDMSNHGYAWWHNALTIDQEDVALKIDSPVLLIQALLDTSVSPSHAAAMAKNLESFGKSNLVYKEYDNLDHSLNDGFGEPQMSLVVKDIETWLKGILK